MSPQIVPGALRNTLIWQRLRHKVTLLVARRANSQFTGFLRLPTQFEALAGPVVSAVTTRLAPGAPLRIGVLGCSNGAEAFTVASVLCQHHPDLAFRIHAYDIAVAALEKARSARYTRDEVFNNTIITDAFVKTTFDQADGEYRVKPRIRERTVFEVADVLTPGLETMLGQFDILLAQNFIFHLSRRLARRALANVRRLLHPGSALFLDGVDLDLRLRFVRQWGLTPVDFEVEQIHYEARRARGEGWPYEYWGLDPFRTADADWLHRYATIFLVP